MANSYQTIQKYKGVLTELNDALHPSQRKKFSKDELQEKMLTILCIRDELEHFLQEQYQARFLICPSMLEEIYELDKQLKKYSDTIARYLDLEKWRKLYKVTDTERWWWYSLHPCDRLDWLWKSLTAICLVILLSLAVDTIPRFWAGGPSVWGSIAIVGPALLTWFLGKDPSEGISWIRGKLDAALEKTRISIRKPYRQEVALILVIIFTAFMLFTFGGIKGKIANYYYQQAKQQLDQNQDSNSTKEACPNQVVAFIKTLILKSEPNVENNLKRAIAFNPDHAEAHFELAFLYERRQDLEEARKAYRLAMQSGSNLAGIRLANLYLMEGKLESANIASAILLYLRTQNRILVPEMKVDKETQKSLYVALGQARLQQERYQDAEDELQSALPLQEELEKSDPETSKTIYCALGDTLDKRQTSKNFTAHDKKEYKQKADNYWNKCFSQANPGDPNQDKWLKKARKRIDK